VEYFLDTSYLVAITHKKDQYHNQAVNVRKTLIEPVKLITTNGVLMEYGNILSKIKIREKAFRYIQFLKEDQNTEIIFINSKIFDKGLEFFGKYKDKEWGLVDCISFVLMREKGIFHALTSDEHFEQAGFTILLKP
jgi:predicted nucleic acid-binding protein